MAAPALDVGSRRGAAGTFGGSNHSSRHVGLDAFAIGGGRLCLLVGFVLLAVGVSGPVLRRENDVARLAVRLEALDLPALELVRVGLDDHLSRLQ